MATVKQCDRCGAIFEYDSNAKCNAIELLKIDLKGTMLHGKPIDLCPSCVTKLKSFLNGQYISSNVVKAHIEATSKVQKAYDILTAHPFVDDDPHKAIEEAIRYLGEALDS